MVQRVTDKLKTNGRWSWRKIAAAAAVPLMMFALSTGYSRYSWMRDQCYKVAVNEKAIIQAGEDLKAKDKWLEDEIDKNNGILHGRLNKEQDKREKDVERMTDMIFKMLQQQQKQVEIQQKGLEKQEQFYMQQQAR